MKPERGNRIPERTAAGAESAALTRYQQLSVKEALGTITAPERLKLERYDHLLHPMHPVERRLIEYIEWRRRKLQKRLRATLWRANQRCRP